VKQVELDVLEHYGSVNPDGQFNRPWSPEPRPDQPGNVSRFVAMEFDLPKRVNMIFEAMNGIPVPFEEIVIP
jgi:hypothetical protein